MIEHNAPLQEALLKPRQVRAFDRVESYVQNLRAGDRFVWYVLGGLVCITSIVSLFALERSVLIKVPAYGGSLTEGELGSPRFVNPLLAISDADRDLAALTYAGLMGLSDDGTVRPVLAENYTVSQDGKQYTVTLRPNAVFSDGTQVRADDVVFTIQKAQDPALKSPVYADWSGVSAEVVDARTIRFTLAKPYAPFLQNLTLGILPERLWSGISNEEFPFSTLETDPLGAGPFKVASISRDASGLITSYTLVRNSRYVLGKPYLSEIRFVFFSRAEDIALALAKGSIDSAYGIPHENAVQAPYARVFGVFFNPNQNQIFTHLEVRKALSIAINRAAIVEGALGGYATPLMGPVPPGSGITETPVATSSDPIAAAAAILTTNGWTYDGTTRVWKKGKETLDALVIKTSNVPELKATATAVKADWEKLGIATDIELYEPGDLNQNVIRPRKYGALLFGMVIGRDQDLYAFWDSQERNDPGLNIAMYTNKTVDDLLEKARQTSDPKERLAALQKVNDLVAADYPAAFTEAPDFIYAVPPKLKGVALPQIATPSDRFATVEQWYLETDAVWPFLARGIDTSVGK
ncbi:MAG TPA: peptide ABC transporter substrate-binding protein [Candidatus Paceibacterota bacterium]|nr:peptide ABC transporter substrate-binding protein [Candidatus Paceibacterota bacterium]